MGPLGEKNHSIFTAARNSGPGWMGWHKLTLDQMNSSEHAPMKSFLQQVISMSLRPGNSVASSMLVLFDMFVEACAVPENDKAQKKEFDGIHLKYATLFACLSQGQLNSPNLLGPEHPFSGLESALTSSDEASLILRQSIPGQKDAKFKVSKDARTAFWKRNESPENFCNSFPRFVCFMHSLCCVKDVDGDIRKASLACVSAVFRALCASVFGLQDEVDLDEGINSIMLTCSSSMCTGYFPRSDSLLPSGGGACLCCNQPHAEHLLRHTGRVSQGNSDAELQFMRLVCRVGSMGWDSHSYMNLVHGDGHLGGQFNKDNVGPKQSSFSQHLCLNIFGAYPSGDDPATCELCRSQSLVERELPEGVQREVQYLRQERAKELLGLVAAVDAHFVEAARYAELLKKLEGVSSSLSGKAAEQFEGILKKLKENPHHISPSDVKFCCEKIKLSDEDAALMSPSAAAGSSAKHQNAAARSGIRGTESDSKPNTSQEQEHERQPAAAIDDDTEDVLRLVGVLDRARVVPASKRREFARKLLDKGVCDEQSIWSSLRAHPPDFDLINDIGMTAPQQRSLDSYLQGLNL
jgi:hypothetical protein